MKSSRGAFWVFLLGIAAAAAAGYAVNNINRLSEEKLVEQTSLQIAANLQARFGKYHSLIETTRAFLTATSDPAAEWGSFTSNLDLVNTYPEIYELSYISSPIKSGKGVACPILEVAPASLDKDWRGFNACGSQDAVDVLTAAAKSGQVVLTGRTPLGTGPSQKTLVGMYISIGQLGWVGTHVDINKLMEDTLPHTSDLAITIYSGSSTDQNQALYQSSTPTALSFVTYHASIKVADGFWFMVVAKPYSIGVLPIAAAGSVILITLLFMMLTMRSGRDRQRIETTAIEMSEKYAMSEARLAGILYNVSDGIFRVKGDWSLDFVNGELARQFGYHTSAQMKAECHKLSFQNPAKAREVMAKLVEEGKCHNLEAIFSRFDGSQFIGLISATAVKGQGGRVDFYDGAISDITLRKAQEEKIHELAYYDTVTKLPNRLHLYESLDRYIAHAKHSNHIMAVMFIDLDRFKLVNDTLGHSVGDALLMKVSDKLKQAVRTEDLVARQGGDEFVVLMPHISSTDEVDSIADRIIKAVGQPHDLGEHEVRTSPSIGIAVYPDQGDDRETLLRHADIAMFEAKNAGRNTYRFYSPEMQTQASERLGIESDLGKALQNKELLVEYEPVANLPGLRFGGAEARLRWKHPRHGTLESAIFMSVAAQSGLATEIGNWQLRMVCAHMEKFREMGVPPFEISVPVTEVQLKRGAIDSLVNGLLGTHRLQGKWLKILVSAKTVEVNARETQTALQALRDMGIKVGLLDFNTEKSTMGILKSLQLDEVVLSERVIRKVPEDSDKKNMLESVISSIRARHMRVTVKGIDNAAQIGFLTENKCDSIQGTFYSPILNATKLAAFAKSSLTENITMQGDKQTA